MDPYVELALFDPASKETRRQETSHLQNEPNPKWGEKFDFAMVSAPSILTGAALNIFTSHTVAGRRAHAGIPLQGVKLLLLMNISCYMLSATYGGNNAYIQLARYGK